MKEKILITGGAGFIGSHLAEALAGRYDLVLLDNLRRDSLRYASALLRRHDVAMVEGDVTDRAVVDEAMAGAAAVVHLAAIAGVSSYYSQPATTLRVNILGTLNVLEAMLRTGTRQLIYFSSSEVYGPQDKTVDEESHHVLGPVSERRWVYAVSKLASEQLTLRYGEEHGLLCSSVRPFNVYGPRQTGEGAISNFCRALKAGEPLKIYGGGEDVRAWCYVSDLVRAVLAMLGNPVASGMAFNIGNPAQRVTTRELAELLLEISGRGTLEHVAREHAPIPFRSPDVSRARRTLGFEPEVDLRTGLERTWRWFSEEEER